MSPVQLGQMGGGRAWCSTSCTKLEVLLVGWECGGAGLMGIGTWWRLALSLVLLVSLPDRTANARVSSSLSTTHHVHHFHNKHGTVPIAINRMPFLTRGGHGKSPSHGPVHTIITSQFCLVLMWYQVILLGLRSYTRYLFSHWYFVTMIDIMVLCSTPCFLHTCFDPCFNSTLYRSHWEGSRALSVLCCRSSRETDMKMRVQVICYS